MNNIIPINKKKTIIVFISFVTCVLISVLLLRDPRVYVFKRLMFNEIAYPSDFVDVETIATRFAYHPDNELSRYSICGTSMINDCGIVLVYYTDDPIDIFRRKIYLDDYAIDIHSDDVSFYELSFSVERSPKKTITIDGKELNDKIIPTIPGAFWRLSKGERSIDISYFDIKSSRHTIRFNNETVIRNIVIIVYETLDLSGSMD